MEDNQALVGEGVDAEEQGEGDIVTAGQLVRTSPARR